MTPEITTFRGGGSRFPATHLIGIASLVFLCLNLGYTRKAILEGDVMLGGLFPVHQKGLKTRCGAIFKDRGIQRLEAMLFAVEKINSDPTLLGKIKLGAIILDTCSSDSYALNQSLEFIRASINTVDATTFECADGSAPTMKFTTKPITGVVGGSYSEVSLQVANLLRLFKIPQISPASTGTSLSDKSRYDFFARTVPPDTFQAIALVDLVQSFNWSYVSLVSSEGQYGDSGMTAFQKEARSRNICIAVNEKVPHSATEEVFDAIYQNLLQKISARGVVLFTRAEDAAGVLRAAMRSRKNVFTWVASDGWGKQEKLVEGLERAAEGAITVELHSTEIAQFNDYMKNLTPNTNIRNPWFEEYWESVFSCTLPQNVKPNSNSSVAVCSPNLRLDESVGYTQESKVQFVVDAVYAFAHALDNVWRELCEPKGEAHCHEMRTLDGSVLYLDYILNVSFSARSIAFPPEQTVHLAGFLTSLFWRETVPTSMNCQKQSCSFPLQLERDWKLNHSVSQHPQFRRDSTCLRSRGLAGRAKTGNPNHQLTNLEGVLFLATGSKATSSSATPIGRWDQRVPKAQTQTIVSFNHRDLAGNQVKFDRQGDGLGRYTIYNYQRDENSSTYHYKVVGKWFDGLHMDLNDVRWPSGKLTSSVCSQPCEIGEVKITQSGDVCCWICHKCHDWEYVQDEFTCMDCGHGRWPYPHKQSCYDLDQQYMRWDSLFAIVPMTIATFGILLTFWVMVVFFRNNDTPIVKAAGRELSYLLLTGIMLCYFMTFVMLAKPTRIFCGLQRFGIGFSFSIIYASLLTKTNRISRIFESARRSARRPSFISPKSQLAIASVLISVQVIGTAVWFLLEPPGIRQYYPDGKRNQVILKCSIRDSSFLLSLIYNMLLITICTVYAVKTRKIPENFNESKFIGFTMYTTCIIWLAFVPIYFGTGNSFEVQITTLCVSTSLSAYVALFCLFSPKVYIIIFHPDKNVRKLTMNSATYKRAPTSSTCGTSVNQGNGKGTTVEQVKLSVHMTPSREQTTETDKDSLASL